MPAQTHYVHPSFNIQATGIDCSTAHLLLEAGPAALSFVIADAENCFGTVVTYALPKENNYSALAQHISTIIAQEPLLQQSFKKTTIVWALPESILVPAEFHSIAANKAMLELMYGDVNPGLVRSDFMFRHNIYNVYRLPEILVKALPASLQYVNQTHQYSLLADMVEMNGNRLWALFYNNRLTAVLVKEGKLQLIQSFEYAQAEDAAYQLLNICERFSMDKEEILVQLSGMIDTGSSLYAEVYKYFMHLQLQELPAGATYSDAVKAHPSHFFSHLFAQALCV